MNFTLMNFVSKNLPYGCKERDISFAEPVYFAKDKISRFYNSFVSLLWKNYIYVSMSVGAKRIFLQLNYCKNLYHQSQRENMKITVNIKVIRRHNENLLTLAFYKSHNNYVADKLFHTLNTKNNDAIFHVNSKAPSTLL